MRKLIYIAIPYIHPDPDISEWRYNIVTEFTGRLMKEGVVAVFSPITHSHPIHLVAELPGDWEYWKQHDEAYLSVSKKLIVLTVDGWEESIGVTAEIAIAKEMGIPIEYIDPVEYLIKGDK